GEERRGVLAASAGGDEERAECHERDRDQHREPAPASGLLLAATSQRHGTRCMRGRRHRPDRSGPPADLQPRVVPQGVRIERQRALEPVRRAAADGWAWLSQEPCSIDRVSAPAGRPPRIQIPRWIQLVGLPLLLVFAWVLARAAGHALFLFLVAALLALLLDPIVLALGKLRIRRGISVALVYVTFAGALVVIVVALATVVVSQTRTAANRFNAYFTVQ